MNYEPPDGYDFEDEADLEVSEKSLTQQIDIWLAEARPERYLSTEKDWMDAVVDRAVDEIRRLSTPRKTAEELARRRTYQREGIATRQSNRVLYDIGRTGQLPLWWCDTPDWRAVHFEYLHAPVAVCARRKLRVRFGAVTAEDWGEWITEHDREAEKRREAEEKARGGAEWLLSLLRQQRRDRTEDLRN